jgi:hypothetical protein
MSIANRQVIAGSAVAAAMAVFPVRLAGAAAPANGKQGQSFSGTGYRLVPVSGAPAL